MSVSKYVSNVKIIPQNVEVVFDHLSDFGNLARYLNQDVLSAISEKVPQFRIQNFESDHDSCRFEIGSFGPAEIRITDRSPFQTIKIESSEGLPAGLKFWIQLLPVEPYKTKLRLTLHVEMGFMVRMLAGDKLEKGIDQLADALALLPYRPV
jgi:hypothetical protein